MTQINRQITTNRYPPEDTQSAQQDRNTNGALGKRPVSNTGSGQSSQAANNSASTTREQAANKQGETVNLADIFEQTNGANIANQAASNPGSQQAVNVDSGAAVDAPREDSQEQNTVDGDIDVEVVSNPQGAALEDAIESVRQQYNLPNTTISISAEELDVHMQQFGSRVDFERALGEAVNSFLHDHRDVESVGAIIKEMNGGDISADALNAEVHDYLNRESTHLRLCAPDENTESQYEARQYWIFNLRVNDLSDHIQWAVVDRQGMRPTLNYGFN